MTNIRNALIQSAGSAGGDKVYVEDVFSTQCYIGNGSTKTITNGIDLSGEGGMVWTKTRPTAYPASIVDTVRGIKSDLRPSGGDAAATLPATAGFAAFNDDGYTVNQWSEWGSLNTTEAHVSFTFRKQEGFFDVVTATASGATFSVNHNLGTIPKVIIGKETSGNGAWYVYHASLGTTKYTMLDSANAAGTFSLYTSITDSSFSYNGIGNTGANYIFYLFGDDASFGDGGDEQILKTGIVTANPNTSVTLGFEPQWLLLKKSNGTEDWLQVDNMRGTPTGANDAWLSPNTAAAEVTNWDGVSFTATGFTLQNMSAAADFIYMAIRRGPMKEPDAGTDVFQAQAYTGDGSTREFALNITPDWTINTPRNIAGDARASNARLTGSGEEIYTNGNQGLYDAGSAGMQFDYTKKIKVQSYRDTNTEPYINWHFQRYPKVFDVAVYTGDGSGTSQAHNLTVIPELKIIKNLGESIFWVVGGSVISGVGGRADNLVLDSDAATASDSTYWDAADTATTFSIKASNGASSNNGINYVAYLFATLAGISKVGTYTGTGNDLNVTGLGAAARFVMIKRTDNTGGWYVYDSTRGIVSGNDPYLFLNDNAVEVTNTDYIDAHASGFTITSSAPDGLNASGGTYLYLAFS